MTSLTRNLYHFRFMIFHSLSSKPTTWTFVTPGVTPFQKVISRRRFSSVMSVEPMDFYRACDFLAPAERHLCTSGEGLDAARSGGIESAFPAVNTQTGLQEPPAGLPQGLASPLGGRWRS